MNIFAAVLLVACLLLSVTNTFSAKDDGELLLVTIGGNQKIHKNDNFQILQSVEVFSLTKYQQRADGANHTSPLCNFGSLAVNDSTIYVIGGETSDSGQINNFSIYNVTSGTWQYNLPSMPRNVSQNTLLIKKNKLLTIGGGADGGNWMTNVYAINATADANGEQWKKRGILPDYVDGASCIVTLKSRIYVLLGAFFYWSKDLGKGWAKVTTKQIPRSYMGRCMPVDDDAILAIGNVGDGSKQVQMFNTTTKLWTDRAPMNVARDGMGVVNLPGTREYLVCGGSGVYPNDVTTNTCEFYNFDSDTWTMANFTLQESRELFGFHIVRSN